MGIQLYGNKPYTMITLKDKIMRRGLAATGIILILCFISCKKDKNKSPGDNRLHSISDGNFFTHYHSYDNQNRLTRIDFDAGSSLRFEYTGAGVLIQQYNGETPNANMRYDLTLVNGRAVSGRQYLPANKLNEYSYQYDGQQRLSYAEIQLKTNSVTTEQHYYSFIYDTDNNIAEIRFKRKVGAKNEDSISLGKTYYTDKPFITWRDIGFDYFGAATVSVDNFGYGTNMPQLFGYTIRPLAHAPKSITHKIYIWSNNVSWIQLGATGEQAIPATQYAYDDRGRLSRQGSLLFTWQ